MGLLLTACKLESRTEEFSSPTIKSLPYFLYIYYIINFLDCQEVFLIFFVFFTSDTFKIFFPFSTFYNYYIKNFLKCQIKKTLVFGTFFVQSDEEISLDKMCGLWYTGNFALTRASARRRLFLCQIKGGILYPAFIVYLYHFFYY